MPDPFIHFVCVNCGSKLRSHSQHAGKSIQCSCGAKCTVPIGLEKTQELPVYVANIKTVWARIYGKEEDQSSPLLMVMIFLAMLLAFAGFLIAVRQTT